MLFGQPTHALICSCDLLLIVSFLGIINIEKELRKSDRPAAIFETEVLCDSEAKRSIFRKNTVWQLFVLLLPAVSQFFLYHNI